MQPRQGRNVNAKGAKDSVVAFSQTAVLGLTVLTYAVWGTLVVSSSASGQSAPPSEIQVAQGKSGEKSEKSNKYRTYNVTNHRQSVSIFN